MPKYTFETRVDRVLSPREIFKQLMLLLKRSREKKFAVTQGFGDIKEDIKNLKRWGGLEGFIIARGARQVPNRLALIDDDGQLTYEELYRTFSKGHGECASPQDRWVGGVLLDNTTGDFNLSLHLTDQGVNAIGGFAANEFRK